MVKYSKKEVGYEDPAKGMDHCDDCRHYEGGSCEIVSGAISREAWCRKFTPEKDLAKEHTKVTY
jgi:hypothetical protein